MPQESRNLFVSMLKGAGIPTTRDAMQREWNAINAAHGSRISNDSAWSPFWRLISAMVTAPAQWLVALLVDHALPNTFLRYASGAWLDVYAWGVDVHRKAATVATGKLLFTRTTSNGELVIPAGTLVESPALASVIYRVATLRDAVIPEGETSALIDVAAEQAGAAYNLGTGYYSILTKPVEGVATVSNLSDWLTTPGTNEESDEALRLRTRNQFAAVGQYHHDAAYKALIAQYAAIRTDYLFFEKDAPRGAGTANCHVMVESGVPPEELIDSLNDFIRESGNHGHGDDMQCVAITEKPVAMDATVYAVPQADATRREALRLGVENRIRSVFRENTDFAMTKSMPLSRLSISRLGEELHAALPDLLSVEITYTLAGETTAHKDDIVALLELPTLTSLSVELAA